MAGLLDDPMTAGLTQMAFGLLGASGPSARPVSLGQAMGAAGPQAMGAYRQAQEAQQQQQAMKLQELMRSLQVQEFLTKQAQQAKKEAALAALPPEQRQFYTLGGSPSDWANLNKPMVVGKTLMDRSGKVIGQDATWQEEQAANRAAKAAENERRLQDRKDLMAFGASLRPTGGVGAAAGKAPSGYRFNAVGDLEAIPGGPADQKKQGAFNADVASMTATETALNRLAEEANALKQHQGLKGITGLRGAVPDIPGTDAANARAKLETLRSQVAFGTLQAMRDASKTGGALGAVSEKELKLLESNLAALSTAQSMSEFQAALDQIMKRVEESKVNLRRAFNMKHQGEQVQTEAPNDLAAQAAAELARRSKK